MADNVNISKQIAMGEKTDWFTVLAAELQTTADRTSSEFRHPDSSIGLLLKFVVANEAGAFSATVNIITTDPAGDDVIVYTSAAVTANGTVLYLIKPGGATNSLFTVVPSVLPRVFKVKLAYTGTPATDKADTTVYGCFI